VTVLALRRKPTPATPDDLAAAVEKPDELVQAEAERERLEQRRADLRKRLDAAKDAFDRFPAYGASYGVLVQEEKALGAEVEANRRTLLSARRAYAEEVASALQPAAEAAARQLLAAIADADAAVDILAAIEKTRAAAECRAVYPSRRLETTHLSNLCRRILAASPKGAPWR
jgi:hypothetical protein